MVRFTLQFMFKHVEVTGTENFKKDQQVILVGNHPTAFMEALLLSTWFLRRPMHYMIRGDMWKPGFLSWLLDAIHGVPVYRKSEGYTAQEANRDTFQRCVDLILAKQLLIIFAEGSHQMVRRIRPFKKGTARIALQAMQANPDEELYAMPISAVFNAPITLRRSAHVTVGKGIPLRQFITDNDARTIKAITEVMYNGVAKELPTITEPEELLFEKTIYEQAAFGKPFSRQWRDAQNVLDRMPTEERAVLAASTTTSDVNLENKVLKNQMSWYHWVALAVFAIPSFIGKIFHWPIIKASDIITHKMVKKPEFVSSLQAATLMVLMTVYYLILIILSLLIFGHLWYFLAVIVLGLISLRYFDLWRVATA